MGLKFQNIDREVSKNKESKRRMLHFCGREDFNKLFGDSDKILDMIFMSRAIKEDKYCPSIGCGRLVANYKKVEGKPAYRCNCGRRVYPLKGTPLEGVRTPLNIVMKIIYEVLRSKHGQPVTEIVRDGYVAKYQTAHHLMQCIGDWMRMCVQQIPFKDGSEIEVDEVRVAIGPKYNESETRLQIVVTMVDRKAGLTKVYPIETASTAQVRPLFEKNFNKSHLILTDEAAMYRPLRLDFNIRSVNHKKKEYSRNEYVELLGKVAEISINRNENFNGSIKVSIHRVHRGVTKRFLPAYINQMAFLRAFSSSSTYQCVQSLLESLPPLFIDGKKRTKEEDYKIPNWEWPKAA